MVDTAPQQTLTFTCTHTKNKQLPGLITQNTQHKNTQQFATKNRHTQASIMEPLTGSGAGAINSQLVYGLIASVVAIALQSVACVVILAVLIAVCRRRQNPPQRRRRRTLRATRPEPPPRVPESDMSLHRNLSYLPYSSIERPPPQRSQRSTTTTHATTTTSTVHFDSDLLEETVSGEYHYINDGMGPPSAAQQSNGGTEMQSSAEYCYIECPLQDVV